MNKRIRIIQECIIATFILSLIGYAVCLFISDLWHARWVVYGKDVLIGLLEIGIPSGLVYWGYRDTKKNEKKARDKAIQNMDIKIEKNGEVIIDTTKRKCLYEEADVIYYLNLY